MVLGDITLLLFLKNIVKLRFIRIIGNLLSSDRKLTKELKQVLGFYPFNLSVYKLAFQHKSAAIELQQGIKLSNERLEFLGDAVLGIIISDYLYKKFPYKEEGFLTEMRSKIVSRKNLKRLAKAMQLENYIIHNVSGTIYDSIYGDAVEALIGAVYIDRGYNKANHFVQNRIVKYHIDIDELEFTEENYKGKLLNWAQKEKKEVVFNFINEDSETKLISMALVIDNVEITQTSAFSKKRAEQKASEFACDKFEILTPKKS